MFLFPFDLNRETVEILIGSHVLWRLCLYSSLKGITYFMLNSHYIFCSVGTHTLRTSKKCLSNVGTFFLTSRIDTLLSSSRVKCIAQRHNTVPPVSLDLASLKLYH